MPDEHMEITDFNFKSTFDARHLQWILRHSSDRDELHHYPIVSIQSRGHARPNLMDVDWPMAGGGIRKVRLTKKQKSDQYTEQVPPVTLADAAAIIFDAGGETDDLDKHKDGRVV